MSDQPNAEPRTLYPPLEPYATHRLPVGDGHELYVEECGNPAGRPVVALHGGPGGNSTPAARRFFDPEAYRIILFDQRGAGQSTPSASQIGTGDGPDAGLGPGLIANTTWHSVADTERVRTHLGIDRWHVFGGSWGSTLALAYAQAHPGVVTALVLRGIFLLRRSELQFFYQDGASHLFPDAWEDYVAPIPVAERGDLIAAYRRRLVAPPSPAADAERLRCAHAWTTWERRTSTLLPVDRTENDLNVLTFARIENHYFTHGAWLRDGQLLEPAEIARIRHIPGVIVQGRYDVVCPARSAWDLHRAWPEARFVLCPQSGHSMREPEIMDALITATDDLR